jgi:hypothetical protein
VASDGFIAGISSFIYNTWGGHQPRIVVHADGTVRLLYLRGSTTAAPTWRLMKRSTAGAWEEEASGSSHDDVALLRDATTDLAHVLAWPGGVATVHTSPGFVAKSIPGAWQSLPANARHYGNAGIGPDGTVCLKTSREFSVVPLTSATNTEYACGKHSATTSGWTWSAFVSHPIGARHAYDYVFPNPQGMPAGLYGTSTRDLYKDASNVPGLIGWSYVFNGIRLYATGTSSDASWQQWDTAEPIAAKAGATVAPRLVLVDSVVTSDGRVYSTYFAEDPDNEAMRGFYTHVADAAGVTLARRRWTELQTYGHLRLVEDASRRLWLLWSAQGARQTQVKLHRVTPSTSGTSLTLSVGAATDLSDAFQPYSEQGTFYIAAPRGGTDRSLAIDAIFNACTTTYTAGENFDNTRCHGLDKSGRQRVFYVRIRLPD